MGWRQHRASRRGAAVDMQVRSTFLLSECTREPATGDPEQFLDVEGRVGSPARDAMDALFGSATALALAECFP